MTEQLNIHKVTGLILGGKEHPFILSVSPEDQKNVTGCGKEKTHFNSWLDINVLSKDTFAFF